MQLTTIFSMAILALTQTQVLAIALPEPLNVIINIEDSNLGPAHTYRTSSRLRNEPVHAQCFSAGSDCFQDNACCWNNCKWEWGSFPGKCQGNFKLGSVEEAEFMARGGI